MIEKMCILRLKNSYQLKINCYSANLKPTNFVALPRSPSYDTRYVIRRMSFLYYN